MSFHDSYMSAKFLLGCFCPLILGFIFLVTPGVEHWRAIPAFVFSGVLFWIYFRAFCGTEEESAVNRNSDLQRLEPKKTGELSESHRFHRLTDMDPEEAEKALLASCIAERLSETETIIILLKERTVPDLSAWQAALDRLSCGVTLRNAFSIEPDAKAILHADFAGNEYQFETEFFELRECGIILPPDSSADELCAGIGASQTDIRQWVCLLFVAASLANTVNGLILDHDEGEDATELVDSASLVLRARILVNAGFPESVFPRSHWSGPETTLD